MIESAPGSGSPSRRLRVRALRLIAERRVGRRLTHVAAMDLLERHGGVDAAIDAMVAELAPRPSRPIAPHGSLSAADTVVATAAPSQTAAVTVAPASRLSRRLGGTRRTALAVGSVTALPVAIAALAHVVSAANAGHGARSTLVLGTSLLVAAILAGVGAIRRGRGRRPHREATALAFAALGAAVAGAGELCALAAPFGLERLLDYRVVAGAIALTSGAIALSAAMSFSDRESRAPARAGSRTPA